MKSKIADGGGSNDGSDGGSAGAAGNKRHRGTDDQARMEEVNISHKDPLPGCFAIASRAALLLSSSLSFSFSLSLYLPPSLPLSLSPSLPLSLPPPLPPSPSPSLSFDSLHFCCSLSTVCCLPLHVTYTG